MMLIAGSPICSIWCPIRPSCGWAGIGCGARGAKTAGLDGATASLIVEQVGVEEFLDELRGSLKDRSFRPLPVRERMIPMAGGKVRRLGIATITDRVVQASLKLVLEPIFEADFHPCSYGFRPGRRAHDAVAEVWYLTSKPRSYEWIVEGDIKACFDEISHSALMDRMRRRVADRRVLDLVKAFLKSGVLGEDKELRKTTAGTPQGSILSPLLSNVALSVLDDFAWQHRRPYSTPSNAMRLRWDAAPAAARARGQAGNQRPHQRWQTFTDRKKRPVVANVAVARELAGWCWSLATLEPTG
jgi:RNA-directed DNA polymerase